MSNLDVLQALERVKPTTLVFGTGTNVATVLSYLRGNLQLDGPATFRGLRIGSIVLRPEGLQFKEYFQ